ncbi:MAG TPA: aldehyde dehydrogenase family protein, partial [Acidimicrobiia bacterium]
MLSSFSPADGRLLAEYEETTESEVLHHIETAAALQRQWETTALEERAEPMRRMADLLDANRDEIALLMTDEMGKPLAQSLAEVDKSAWGCRHYADNAERILQPDHIEADRAKSYVAYRPLGVILAVMPWNFPFWQVYRFLAPALMGGNGGLL